ncbi:MAG TPA: cyclic nucleotide-binding domain-containing protein [Thermoleophilaceae bacterium]|nr:cyclic nucleotide-binding domain-containing protein [Thermoleophilaceae bacterium]
MDVERLRAIPLFQSVDEEHLSRVAPFVSQVVVSAGKQLVTEGDFAYEFLAIEEGTAEVRRGDEKIAELGPGDYFGEVGLLETETRQATVIAKTEMKLLTLDSWDMKRLEKELPDAAEEIHRTVRERKIG